MPMGFCVEQGHLLVLQAWIFKRASLICQISNETYNSHSMKKSFCWFCDARLLLFGEQITLLFIHSDPMDSCRQWIAGLVERILPTAEGLMSSLVETSGADAR